MDNHRATATSLALDQLLKDEATDWKERAERFRLQEWLLHEEMVEAALAAVREFKKNPNRIKLTDLVRLLDLASVLGRRATGLPLDPGSTQPDVPPVPDGFEAALRKIYGEEADLVSN